ncbi:hypothetical protein [Pseudoalteromonas aliena]|uniref:hypothetical protein n=1 Tax=Pseudoalteromonas aliena TaxID=247523 RepID=UPI002494F7C0|nr:hypothetical protein [Pseudoalteromonas aliena]
MMQLPNKTVPAPNGGTIPLRTSLNPVIGVYKHHCGSIASVHRPKGKRKNTVYMMCDECGTDQCGGKPYQEKIAREMQPTIEALLNAEKAPSDVVNVDQKEDAPATEQKADHVNLIGLNDHERIPVDKPDTVKPLDTAELAVSSQTQTDPLTINQAEKAAVSNLIDTAKPAVQTVTNPINPEQVPPEKAKRVGIFALIGAGLGVLLAI